jgi:hypothetical protein
MGAWDPKRRVIEVENGLNGADELMVLAYEYGHSLGFGRARDGDADTFAAEFLRQRRTRSLARNAGARTRTSVFGRSRGRGHTDEGAVRTGGWTSSPGRRPLSARHGRPGANQPKDGAEDAIPVLCIDRYVRAQWRPRTITGLAQTVCPHRPLCRAVRSPGRGRAAEIRADRVPPLARPVVPIVRNTRRGRIELAKLKGIASAMADYTVSESTKPTRGVNRITPGQARRG